MKTARQLTIAILAILCVTALYGSYHMITDPSGSSLGLPYYLLNGTIFNSYLAGGWILFFTVGILSAVVIICIWKKTRNYSFMTLVQGVVLCIFVIAQIVLLPQSFMIQYVYLFAGLLLIALGVLQNQRKIVVETEKKFKAAPKSHHHKHRKRR
jgi:hypothetical protein